MHILFIILAIIIFVIISLIAIMKIWIFYEERSIKNKRAHIRKLTETHISSLVYGSFQTFYYDSTNDIQAPFYVITQYWVILSRSGHYKDNDIIEYRKIKRVQRYNDSTVKIIISDLLSPIKTVHFRFEDDCDLFFARIMLAANLS